MIPSHYHEQVEGPIRGLRLPSIVWNKLRDENITTFDQLKAAAHQLNQIFGIGPKMAQVIRDEIARVAASEDQRNLPVSAVEDVRRALKPLIDREVVMMVHDGSYGATEGVSSPQERPCVAVAIEDDTPERYRGEAEALVQKEGIDVDLHLKCYALHVRPREFA